MRDFSFRAASSGPGIRKAVERDEGKSRGGKTGAVVRELASRGMLAMVDEVCAARGVTRAELCGTARTRAVAKARAEVWWRIQQWPGRCYSLTEIGDMFGRDHATVRSAIKSHEKRSGAH